MACYTLQTKRNKTFLTIYFIYQCKRNPKISRRKTVADHTHTHTYTKRYGRSFDQIQVKVRNWTLICFIFSHKLWFLSWSFIRHSTNLDMYDHKTPFSWLETPAKKLFLDVNMWAVCDIQSLGIPIRNILIGRLLTRSRINKLVKPPVGPENNSFVRWVGEWTLLVDRNLSTMLVNFAYNSILFNVVVRF